MSTKIKDIIDFYTGHEVSEDIKERVLERISGLRDDEDADIALRNLWNQAESATMDDAEVDSAYDSCCKQVGFKKAKGSTLQIFTWARVAAVVVPLLMLVVFAKIYMQMDSRLKHLQVVVQREVHFPFSSLSKHQDYCSLQSWRVSLWRHGDCQELDSWVGM